MLQRLTAAVRRETVAGALLLTAAGVALLMANSPAAGAYATLSGIRIGPEALHLDLTLAQWAADGLLAVFFFVVGVELKHEFVAGSLRHPREAAVPVVAAVAGMALPAAIYLVVVSTAGESGALRGWAIPTATDIAFALAVLAVFGRGLPLPLRTFLLTLAVVDDLLAIVVIAVAYTATIDLITLAGAIAAVAVFAVIVRSRRPSAWLLAPLAVLTWVLVHESGVHATIAGVLLGLTVPAIARQGERIPRTIRFEHAIRPWSNAVALPVFAFFAAGVTVADPLAVLAQPVVPAIAGGLLVGKLVGVLGATAVVVRFTRLRLPDSIGLRDLLPIGLLAAIGFTVSLLIAELSFPDSQHTDAAKIAVLLGSVVAAALAALLLRWDARRARRRDMNDDGRPDPVVPRIGDPLIP